MTDQLRQDIQAAESCKLTAYKDTKGFWTIGWGHKLLDQTRDWIGHTITQLDADTLLDQDIQSARSDAEKLPEWQCMDSLARQNGLIELVFNMGVPTWKGFVRCRQAMLDKKWSAVSVELWDSDWYNEVGPMRARRIMSYLYSGKYPNG